MQKPVLVVPALLSFSDIFLLSVVAIALQLALRNTSLYHTSCLCLVQVLPSISSLCWLASGLACRHPWTVGRPREHWPEASSVYIISWGIQPLGIQETWRSHLRHRRRSVQRISSVLACSSYGCWWPCPPRSLQGCASDSEDGKCWVCFPAWHRSFTLRC